MKKAILVLLWKYMKEKIRHPIHTIWEMLSGIIVFVILLCIKQLMAQDQERIEKFMQEMNLVDIAFAPTNNLSLTLMSDICQKDYNTTSFGGNVVKCFGLKDEDTLKEFIRTQNYSQSDTFAAINFHNLHGDDYPEQLEYEIKVSLSGGQHVSKLSELYQIFHRDVTISKNTTFFANLQWTIDKAYLENLIGQNIGHEVQFHDWSPHPPRARLMHSLLIYCTVLGPLPFFMYTHSRLVIEKRTGLKELITLVGVSKNILNLSYLLGTAIFALIYSVSCSILLKITSNPILPNSNPIVVAITLFLHYEATVSMTFITSALSQNYQHSDGVALMFYLTTFMLNHLQSHPDVNHQLIIIFISCCLPHAVVFLFWDEVTTLEDDNKGTNFANIWKVNHIEAVIVIWVCTVVKIVLIMFISWYLDMVRPGRFGIAAEWNFLCKKKFWSKKKRKGVNFHVTAEHSKQDLKDDRYFEKAPKGARIAIKIARVSKVFKGFRQPEHRVLDNIRINANKGEITVLLGVNGAGKTTLISIVAGMYSATEGTVYINGLDNSMRLQDLKNDLAYCPQTDLTFDYLTVRENLIFFQRLRGKDAELNANALADNVMLNLKLASKADYYSRQLSAGLRRCLQVGCVLVGDADVLVLDEPTRHMDGPTRHNLWDLLLTLRKEKTILMSTTVMEEADALGDRIAIIHNGKLRCHGSPSFLKNAIGVDFKLSIVLSKNHLNFEAMKQELERTLDESDIQSTSRQVHVHEDADIVSVNLPAHDRDHFPKVFAMLEAKRKELGISALDVGVSMEQVFFRFIEDDPDEASDLPDDDEFLRADMLEGCMLWRQRLKVLILRVFSFVWAHHWQFIFLQILLPVVAIVIINITSNNYYSDTNMFRRPNTSFEEEKSVVLYNPIGYRTSNVINPLRRSNPKIEFIPSSNLTSEISSIKYEKQNQNKFIYNTDKNCTHVYFKTHTPEKLSKAVNIFSNLFMSLNMPSDGNQIHVKYSSLDTRIKAKKPKSVVACAFWAAWTSFLTIAMATPLVLLGFDEFSNGVRFNQRLAGCPPSVIWLSKLLAHMGIYVIISTIVVIITPLLDSDGTFRQPYFLLFLYVSLIIFGSLFFLFWYAASFVLRTENPITVIYISSLTNCMFAPILLQALIIFTNDRFLQIPIYTVLILFCIFPSFLLTVVVFKVADVGRRNAYCKLNFDMCPNFPNDTFVTTEECCSSTDGEPYGYVPSLFGYFIIFLVAFVLYWSLVLLLQHRIIQTIFEHISNFFYKMPPKRYITSRVKREDEYVRETLTVFDEMTLKERQEDEDVLLVSNVHKKRKGTSLKGISFAVRKGECLSIIARNGAGKSTLMQILSGYLIMTRGQVCANGYFLNSDRAKYLSSIAWTFARGFDEFLTAYQNLELLALLFGYSKHSAPKVAMYYLRYMGLTTQMHQLLSSFNSGCTQRLAVCIALMGSPMVVFLEKPYVGVDPHMSRYITRAILRLRKNNVACVITEENLEWKQVDRICTRVGILDHGELVALGSVYEMHHELASGYTVNIKLRVDDAYFVIDEIADTISMYSYKSLSPVESIFKLKREFMEVFPSSILLDEHMSVLYFHIKDPNHKLTYGDMFHKLEALKDKYTDIIEDYILSETSMEEVLTRVEQQLSNFFDSDKTAKNVLRILNSDSSSPSPKSSSPTVNRRSSRKGHDGKYE